MRTKMAYTAIVFGENVQFTPPILPFYNNSINKQITLPRNGEDLRISRTSIGVAFSVSYIIRHRKTLKRTT